MQYAQTGNGNSGQNLIIKDKSVKVEKKLYIEHECRNNSGYIGMLIPFGEYKNRSLMDAEVGCIGVTSDGVTVKLISKSVVAAPSRVANALSYMLYGISIERSLSAMIRNWGYDVYDNKVLFIVVEKVL